nr:DUF4190 domain-containing protein [Mycobacterium genavense]
MNSMTAPGGDSGEDAARAGSDENHEQPGWAAAWESPAAPPPTQYPEYPPPPYPPPGCPLDYPRFTPPFGYQQPPGAPPYPPAGGPPPGYGPPPYPGGYYPDYPGDHWSPEAVRSGTNPMAIAALISSFTGLFCCIGGIAAIVLGTIALDQIKRRRQEGYGMAIAGIVIGVATLLVGLIVMIFAVHFH